MLYNTIYGSRWKGSGFMKLDDLKELHDYMRLCISSWENSDENTDFKSYTVWEQGVLNLYEKIISGEYTRKDFLIFSIRDMYGYIKGNNISCASTLLVRFMKKYGFE